jgi:hypothetical protein
VEWDKDMAKRIDPVTGEMYDDGTLEPTLAEGAMESEEAQVPFEEQMEINPFRYTQQAMNPRAEAVSGTAQRDPRARSAFTGVPAGMGGKPAFDTLYQNTLPMKDVALARGDLDQYRELEGFSEIHNPNSMRGRAAIAQLSGFEGKTQNTLMFDMNTIGLGMGFSQAKIDRLMGGYTANGKSPYGKKFSDEEKFFMGLSMLSSNPGGKAGRVKGGPNYKGAEGADYGKQKSLDLDLDDPRHMAEVVRMGGTAYGMRGRMGQWGNRDPLASQADAGGGQVPPELLAKVMGGGKMDGMFGGALEASRATGTARADIPSAEVSKLLGGGQAKLEGLFGGEFDRQGRPITTARTEGTSDIAKQLIGGRYNNINWDDKKGLFYQQRDIDRKFREAGRVSGSFWETMSDPGNIAKMVMVAGLAAMTGGALGPVLAGALAPTLGLAGAGGVGVAAGLGGSLLTGASMGLTGGAMAGLTQSAMSGFEGGAMGTLKNIGMGAGIGALSGGVMGGLGHGASIAMGGQGFQGLGAGGFSQGDLGAMSLAGADPSDLQAMAALSASHGGAVGGIGGDHTTIQRGGIQGQAGLSDQAGFAEKAYGVVTSPGAKAIGKGLMSGAEHAQAKAAASEQMLKQGTGMVSGAQAGGLGQGLAGAAGLGGQYAQGLPDNPYYNRAYYDDFESGQGEIV